MRYDLATELLERRPATVSWLEIHPENYVNRGGRYQEMLELARRDWPIVTHGLSTCLGAPEPFDARYLRELRAFLSDVEIPWHSEHLCLGGVEDRFFHDLLPLPFTEEAAQIALRRVKPTEVSPPTFVAMTSGARSSGFPRMVATDDTIILAWTDDREPSRIGTALIPR